MKPVMVVAGTRPEVIKLAPVIKWLEKLGVEHIFVWSGQHYDYELSRIFFEQLGIPDPDENLDVGSGTHAEQTAKIMIGLERLIDRYSPAVVAAEGDTNTVMALQMVKICGSISGENNSVDHDLGSGSDTVQIGLFNALYTTGRKDGEYDPVHDPVQYDLPGSPVFLAKTPVKNGSFSQTVKIPRNISFDQDGVRLIAYAWKGGTDSCATGYLDGLRFHGTDTSQIVEDDTIGPRITIRPDYDTLMKSSATFSDRIVSSLPLNFEIDVFDQNGIDVSSTGPDDGLLIEVEGVFAKQNINQKLQFKEGDFRQGSAAVAISDNSVRPGNYLMNISARDLLGNLSKRTFTLEITPKEELKLDHVFNFPNPMRMRRGTKFYFYPSATAQVYNKTPVRTFVRIYTLGGKLLFVGKDVPNGWFF